MKKIAVLLCGIILLMSNAFAGGILTNTNQSAQFVRMLSRNASIDLDAVYFNPAGLTQMENGFYFALNNQSIFQNRTITNDFALLKNHEFKGETKVPAFPSAFAVYKLDRWAFSAGFGPNAGGGTAKYNKGLPSFEMPVSVIPKSLVANGIPTTDYSSAISFEGSSVFWGIQLNGTYEVNKILSVSLGARMINAKNTYSGYLKDIKINPNYPAFGASYTGGLVSATQFFADGNTFLKGLSASAAASAAALAPAVSGGAGSVLLTNGGSIGLSAAQIAGIQQLLGAAGMTPAQIGGTTLAVAAGTLNAAAPVFAGKALAMGANSAATADQNVDAEQTGIGFTPIIGVDIHLDKFNWGIKYEHKTILGLTNKNNKSTTEDRTGKFPDGQKIHNDIPAILASGLDYQVTDKLKASGSFNLYFDKNVDWGMNGTKKRAIDKNYKELSLGLEYKLTDNFALSAGYLNSNTGVSKDYQSDFSYSNDSYTLGLGFQWKLNKKLVLDAGALKTTYKDDTKTITDPTYGTYHETYAKDNIAFAIGLAYKIL